MSVVASVRIVFEGLPDDWMDYDASSQRQALMAFIEDFLLCDWEEAEQYIVQIEVEDIDEE
jgi:hypothetical protein